MKNKKKSIFRKDLKFYFAAPVRTHLVSFVSAIICLIFTLWLNAYNLPAGTIACLILTVVFLADACNFVLIDNDNFIHFHLFRFNEPVLVIPLRGVKTVITSLEKNKPVVFVGGVYTHATVAKNKALWNDLIGKLISDEKVREDFLTATKTDREICEGKYHYKVDTVLVPQLFSSLSFVSHELFIDVKPDKEEETTKNNPETPDEWKK